MNNFSVCAHEKTNISLIFIKNTGSLFIRPQISIYDGEIGKLALEMSPLFVRYCTNTHHTCELVYCLLTSPREEATLHKIQEKLDEYVDLEY